MRSNQGSVPTLMGIITLVAAACGVIAGCVVLYDGVVNIIWAVQQSPVSAGWIAFGVIEILVLASVTGSAVGGGIMLLCMGIGKAFA